jgi:hypothetical protein
VKTCTWWISDKKKIKYRKFFYLCGIRVEEDKIRYSLLGKQPFVCLLLVVYYNNDAPLLCISDAPLTCEAMEPMRQWHEFGSGPPL